MRRLTPDLFLNTDFSMKIIRRNMSQKSGLQFYRDTLPDWPCLDDCGNAGGQGCVGQSG